MAHDDDDEPIAEPKRSRRDFLSTTAIAAAGIVVGCGGGADPDGGALADGGSAGTDAGPGMDAAAADGGGADPDAGAPEEDAGPPEPVTAPEDTPEAGTFGLGVASGDATPTAAVLWTRYDGTAPLRVALFEMDGDSYRRQVLEEMVVPADGGFVHHEVTGLVPGQRYRYAFFEMDGETRAGRSVVGRFRAAVAETSVETLTFAAVSCTRNGRSFDTLARAGERDDLDAFFLLGDTTYADGANTVDEYRAKWAENLGAPGWIAARAATSVLASWDDHEVDNNFDPESRDLTNPTQVFFENLPLRRLEGTPDRIWRSARWGLTAEVFVLDCRGERRSSASEYLSRAQMDWLKAGLMASPCSFKLILNSVPITDFPFPSENDRWEGYPAQRTEILSFIDDQAIGGVLWIAGDFHLASIGRVSPSGPGSTQTEVLAGPGAQTGNPGAWILREPQFDWASTTNNYTSFELLPAMSRIRVRWHDGSGSVIQSAEVDY